MKRLILDERYSYSLICEWVFMKKEKQLFLFFRPNIQRPHLPKDYLVLFENVKRFSLFQTSKSIIHEIEKDSDDKRCVLYELEENQLNGNEEEHSYRKFLSIQPYNSLLEVIAKSYRVV